MDEMLKLEKQRQAGIFKPGFGLKP